jgi:predicted Zn-dependent protease
MILLLKNKPKAIFTKSVRDKLIYNIQNIMLSMKRNYLVLTVLFMMLAASLASSGCMDSPSEPKVMGGNAKGYLQDKKYKRIVVEVDYVDGFHPDSGVLDTLKNRIGTYCDKDKTFIFKDDNFPKSRSSYSLEDIKELEKEYRDYYTMGKDIVAFVLYLNGVYSEDSNVLGLAYSPTSFAIFKEKINDIDIPPGVERFIDSSDYEESVVIHEFGHLLALVNIGYQSDRDHADPGGNHCKFDDCVMFYAIETVSIYDLVTHEDPKPPSDFGEHCRHDLANLKNDNF